MTYFSQIRAGLISTALLLTTALASPAFAESLPEISPRQIASDVEVRYNPQTGAQEYIAPSFDPFEEDRSMAGTASLRSVSNATAIDGQSVRGGALLDMTFYYNSASNDPYDTRGYEEAVYLSGEYAPVTLRNSRILECNEQVQDVVYYHEDYYRPSLHVNLFRPYRHYTGHFGYDRFWDRGYGQSYGYSRGFRGSTGLRGRNDRNNRRNDLNRRGSTTDQLVDRAVDRARRTTTQREDRAATGRRMDRTPSSRSENPRETRRNPSRDRIETRFGGRDGFMGGPRRLGSNSGAAGRRSSSSAAPAPAARAATPRASTTRASTPRRTTSRNTERRIRNNNAERADVRQAAPSQERAVRRERTPRAVTRQAAPRAAAPAPKAQRATPVSRPKRAERSRPARAERAVKRARDVKSRSSSKRGFAGKRSKLKMMSFLPMASSWSRNVVRNVDTQCAREEMLTVHIPQERLDASRFDGLTILVLDRTGQEVPVYVPPNYIEGFRQAVNGRAAPNVTYGQPQSSAPFNNGPIYQEPRPYTVESAPCPVGTTKQSDGTCLQGGSATLGGYPIR